MTVRLSQFAALLSLLALGAPQSGQSQTLDDVLIWTGELVLQETPEALVVSPKLMPDPLGGWLYWDPRDAQGRRYDRTGRLLFALGRAGDGPGEFQRIRSLLRIADGRLVTVDARGRVGVWSSAGELQLDFDSGLQDVAGAVALDGSRVLMSVLPYPQGERVTRPVLHVVDVDSRSVVGSFLSLPLPIETLGAAGSVDAPAPKRWRDRVAFALGVVDTIWTLPERTLDASATRVVIPSPIMDQNPQPIPPARSGLREWFNQATFLGDFFRLADGTLIVWTWGLTNGKLPARHGLLRVDPRGRAVWEIKSSMQLLAVDDADNLYFWEPEGMDPSRIRVARLKP